MPFVTQLQRGIFVQGEEAVLKKVFFTWTKLAVEQTTPVPPTSQLSYRSGTSTTFVMRKRD